MKTVQDKNGNTIEVTDNTPCHAGINGALPVMLDETLDTAIFVLIAEREAAYISDAPNRIKQNIKNEISRLETGMTLRRIREAILGIDNGWMANQESLIAIERIKLG